MNSSPERFSVKYSGFVTSDQLKQKQIILEQEQPTLHGLLQFACIAICMSCWFLLFWWLDPDPFFLRHKKCNSDCIFERGILADYVLENDIISHYGLEKYSGMATSVLFPIYVYLDLSFVVFCFIQNSIFLPSVSLH
jgi:hypothetical protein